VRRGKCDGKRGNFKDWGCKRMKLFGLGCFSEESNGKQGEARRGEARIRDN